MARTLVSRSGVAAGLRARPQGRRPGHAAPAGFAPFAGGCMALAAAGAVLLAPLGAWGVVGEPLFWVLAALTVIGELFPIRLPRPEEPEEVTLSTPFAFALLIVAGPLPAAMVYAGASVLHDVLDRRSPLKLGFNAAQYTISLLAAAGVLAALAGLPPLTGAVDGHHLGAVLLAGAVLFAVNQVLVGTGTALATGERVGDLIFGDLAFQGWTAGFLLTLAPVVLAAAERNLLLAPLLFLPMLAVYFGGREAALNGHRAWHDDLTDLPNRLLLQHRLHEALTGAGRRAGQAAVLILDLDEFKAVNDTLGHDQGDRLLELVGRRLQEAAPPDATLARLGGDEFAIVLPHDGAADARAVAEDLLDALEAPFQLGGLALHVDASVGLAAYPQHGASADELLKHADVALYCAKASRARVEAYTAEDDEHTLDRLALAGQLRRGLERGELVVHYQPKLALAGGRPHGAEALVRWNHPQLGLIGPEGFIPLAEQGNLIMPLTCYVVDRALEQCRRWRDDGLVLRVSVNVSARTLLDSDLAREIGARLERWGLPPSALQVEITESRVVADTRGAERVLGELRAMGVSVAIDDFGTGFSSLAQLQRLPVDEIKIDKSFVLDMETNASNAAIVRSTIDLGRNLSLDVTAEGVETPEAFAQLERLGCHFAQGFHLGRPLPAEACRREIQQFMRTQPCAA